MASDTTNTELAATVEAVSPSGDSVPLSSGALLGSQRALDPTQTWTAWNKLPLLPVHPLTAASQKPVVPGTVTENDIQIFPTMAELPPGWSLRITLTTSETPHLLPSLTDLPSLAAGVYQVQRNQGAASVLNVPLAPASDFASSPCGSICSAEGP